MSHNKDLCGKILTPKSILAYLGTNQQLSNWTSAQQKEITPGPRNTASSLGLVKSRILEENPPPPIY